jgi:hypothetical protein
MFFSIDIEEDLDTLEIQFDQNNNLKKSENDKIRQYKNKLVESESRVEELTEMVKKLRYFLFGF